MSFIMYQTNKKTGTTYAYLQEAYRDPVTKRPKSKRTYLGRVDPLTNQIVDKADDGKRNRTKLGESAITDSKSGQTDIDKLTAKLEEQKNLIVSLEAQIEELKQLNKEFQDALQNICAIAGKFSQ